MTVIIRNFSIENILSVSLTSSLVSQEFALDPNKGTDIMIINESLTETIYVTTGPPGIEATLNSMPVLPGEKGIYDRGSATGGNKTFAYIAESVIPFKIVQGEGA